MVRVPALALVCHIRTSGLYSRPAKGEGAAAVSRCVVFPVVFPVPNLTAFRTPVASAGSGLNRATTVNDKRPVNLALGTIQFPLPAIVSLLHRISGFALFGLVPLVLWAWQQSLASSAAFGALHSAVAFKACLILVLAGLVYHLLAGIKHLFMDLGLGETLQGARALSAATLVLSAALIVALGVWIW